MISQNVCCVYDMRCTKISVFFQVFDKGLKINFGLSTVRNYTKPGYENTFVNR